MKIKDIRVLNVHWLLLLSSLAASSTAKVLPNFAAIKTTSCPTPGASLLPQKLTSKLQCAAFCSRLPTCNAFHFDKNTGQCFHGDACSQLEQWTADGDCDSYKYTDVLCGDCDVAEPVLTELKLKLFYKFSRSGLKNEVNPRQFCLTAHDVTVDAGGAHFEGNSGSYLSTKTPGFEKYLQVGTEYSAFTQVYHAMDAGTQYYSRFQECSGSSPGSSLIKSVSLVYGFSWQAGSGNFGEGTFGMSPNFLPSDGLSRRLSVGLTFNQTGHQNFYNNGTFLPVAAVSKVSSNLTTAIFQCLRLGYGSVDTKCLHGDMTCFALSAKVLSLEEFHLLRQLCI